MPISEPVTGVMVAGVELTRLPFLHSHVQRVQGRLLPRGKVPQAYWRENDSNLRSGELQGFLVEPGLHCKTRSQSL